jgi:lipopolysaccharide transport system ATP-binding protein
LAFAVAAHLEPEILLVDEVLAVGDAAFQKRCVGTLDEAATGGRTVLFVSHNMAAIQRLCSRVIWIDQGSIVADGQPDTVIEGYLASVHDGSESAPAIKSPDGSLEIERVVLTREDGGETTVFSPGESIAVDLCYVAHRAIVGAYFWIGVSGRHGHLFGANMLLDGAKLGRLEGRGTLRCVFLRPPLLPQQAYYLRLGAREADGRTVLLPPHEAGYFRVAGSAGAIGLDGDHADWLVGDSTSLLLPYTWKLPDGTSVSVESRAGRLDDG